MQYNFKQIINSLFPALHRFFIHSSNRCNASQSLIQGDDIPWMEELNAKLNLSCRQKNNIQNFHSSLFANRVVILKLIARLRQVEKLLKEQQQIFQEAITSFRRELTPLQTSLMIIFGEKNKLRNQFCSLSDVLIWERAPVKQIKHD